MSQANDAAGGREWNPYELATPIVRSAEPALAGAYAAPPASPYAAPSAHVADVMHEAAAGELAERLTRLLAVLADSVVTLVPIGFAVLAGFRQFKMATLGVQGLSSSASAALMLAGALLLGILVANIVLLVRHGQTIGKRLLGIRIVRTDGSRAGFWRIVLLRMMVPGFIQRLLQAGHPALAVMFALGNVLMIFREDRRCLHDHIADTIVVTADR